MGSATYAIEFKDVSLAFGDRVVLDRVSFAVRHGESRKWVETFQTEDLAYYHNICRTHKITVYQD